MALRRIALLIIAALLTYSSAAPLALPAAVGTLVLTTSTAIPGIRKYSMAWTSDASGNVSGHAFTVIAGQILSVKFVPGVSASQPTDLYDLVLNDTDGVDVLAGTGANLSNATASSSVPNKGTYHNTFVDGSQQLDLVVTNAGNAKSGTVILLIGR